MADVEVLSDGRTQQGISQRVVPELREVQPMVFAPMKANDLNDHDAADILCGECRFVVATLHAGK